jgi:hypothetical protein
MSSRDWQRLSQVLALLLVVLVGSAAIVAFLRSGTPAATPPASLVAITSPTPSDPPTGPTVGPSKTPRPSKTPKPSPSSTPTPRPTPTPGPSETVAPSPSEPVGSTPVAVPARTIHFVGVGFDSTAATTPKARQIGFDTDGPGTVTVKLVRATATDLHFCLMRIGGSQTCQDGDHAVLNGTTSAAGKTSWVVSGIGTSGASPIADVVINFGALHPNVTVNDFRFQGTENSGFNGVEADLNNGPGTIKVRGTITSSHPWRVRLVDGDFNQLANQQGSATAISFQQDTTANDLHLTIAGTELLTEEEVFLDATIRWQ